MKLIVLRTLLVLLSAAVLVPAGARAADLILNEYNAVDDDMMLDNSASDVYWGRRAGNGGDWFELVVIRDHLDVRGWTLLVVDDAADSAARESFALKFTNEDVWSDLRSGTIVTVSEGLGADVDDYQPAAGRWWINVRASPETDGRYMTVACVLPACAAADAYWKVSRRNWQLTIKNALGGVVFGPAGEGIKPATGVGPNEVFKLEEDPDDLVTAAGGAYADGTSSTFGQPNSYAGGTRVQDFAALRSVVPFVALSSVRLNEVFAHSDPGFDWVEIYNGGDTAVDVGGWYLSDSFGDLTRYRIADGTTIAPDGHLVLDDDELGFAFSSVCGDKVVLSEAGESGLTGGRDFIEFDPTETGVSVGRFPDGADAAVRMSEATREAANWLPLVGPVVVNEIMYHPADPVAGISVNPEFIELHNSGQQSVALSTDFGAAGEYPWRISGGVDFDFAPETSLPAGGFLLVVAFDPVADPNALAEFRSIYGLDDATAIVGPYAGKLGDFSDRVRLRKPDTPEAFGDICGGSGNPSPYVPYVPVDEVTYWDFGLWPAAADGSGPSLERIRPLAPAGEPRSWIANLNGAATPGAANSSESAPTPSQRECLLSLNSDLVRLIRAQERNNLDCMRDWTSGRSLALSPDLCVGADQSGRVAEVQDAVELHFAQSCAGDDLAGVRREPFVAAGNSAAMFEAATDQALGLLASLFGDDLAAALASPGDRSRGRCQVRGAWAAHRCLRSVTRAFRSCVRLGLGAGAVRSADDLVACIGADAAGKVAGACDPLSGTLGFELGHWCADQGVDLAEAFPVCAGVSAPDVATCLGRHARCGACRALDRARMLYRDCDLFDDGLSNTSCP